MEKQERKQEPKREPPGKGEVKANPKVVKTLKCKTVAEGMGGTRLLPQSSDPAERRCLNVVAEMALAHAIGDKVEAAYRRGDLFEKRRRMMRDWGKFTGKVQVAADVVAIQRKGQA